jgi:hypothetical protein
VVAVPAGPGCVDLSDGAVPTGGAGMLTCSLVNDTPTGLLGLLDGRVSVWLGVTATGPDAVLPCGRQEWSAT